MAEQTTGGVSLDELRELCIDLTEMDRVVAAAEADLADRKRERKALQQRLANAFADAGMQNLRLDGRTYYLATSYFANKAGGVDQNTVCMALRDAGLGDYVQLQFSPAKLKAHLRELHEAMPPGTPFEDVVPDELRGLINVYEEVTVRSRS